MAPAPMPRHQIAARGIFRAPDSFALGESSGEVYFSPSDVGLPSGEAARPEVFFLTPREAKRVPPPTRLHVAPSPVVEIPSPGTQTRDAITERELYRKNGVREYWIVDPDAKAIAQRVLREKRYAVSERGAADTIKSGVPEGFEMKAGGPG